MALFPVELPVQTYLGHRFLLISMTTPLVHAPGRSRTCNRPVKSRRLCRLSYECVCRGPGTTPALMSPVRGGNRAAPRRLHLHKTQPFRTTMHWEGFEPPTSGFVDRSSVQLSYQCRFNRAVRDTDFQPVPGTLPLLRTSSARVTNPCRGAASSTISAPWSSRLSRLPVISRVLCL